VLGVKRKGATIALDLDLEHSRSPPEAASWQPPGPQPAPAAVIEPLEGPQLVWLGLRPPYYVYVLALTLLDLGNRRRPRLDVISTSDVRRWLRLRRGNWRGLEKVIRNAVRWGLLSPATRRGRAWRGHYVVNWDNVRYVASLVPMNPGDRRLNNDYKRGFGAFRLALEVISDFRAALRGTRVQARGFWPLGGVPEGNVTGVTGLTQLRRLRLSLISLGPVVLPALLLGGGTIYFIPIGVGGGAKSRFPCLSYPNGKYLCAGSVKVLNELIDLAGGVPPEPLPYGGAAARLVVDLPPHGLVPYDLAPGLAPKLEPGVQLYDSALQLCRWHVLLTSHYRLPKELDGWPSLVMLPLEDVAKAFSYSPDSIRSEVLFCLDALLGARQAVMRGLGRTMGEAVAQALAIARTISPPEAVDPPVDIYVEYKPKVKERGRNKWRHDRPRRLVTLEQFISELKGRDSVEVAEFLKVVVPLPDISGLRELLALGFVYGYHNDQKDPPNASRLEFRSYSDVTKSFDKSGLTAVLLGVLALIGQPVAEAWRALARQG
jgi:hypothetical protein